MAQWLGVLGALPEDLKSVPTTHIGLLITVSLTVTSGFYGHTHVVHTQFFKN